jgi:hypothetical protein
MRRKIKITLPPPPPEPKQFRCSVCGEWRDHWQRYIDGHQLVLCNPCSHDLTPPGAKFGWRHYEVFSQRDAATWGDINHLVKMLGAAG